MSLTTLATSLKNALNRAQPGSLPSMLQSILLGDVVRRQQTQLRAVAPTLDPYGPASNTTVVLPDDAKCASIRKAYARAGTGTVGELTIEALGASLSAGQCAPSIDGNIIFDSADAWTSVDVLYDVQHIHVLEATLPVASGVVTLPAGLGVACELLEVQRNDTSTANLIVAAPAAANSTTGTAHFNLAKTTVLLDSADSATSVRVKLGVVDPVDVNKALEAASTFI
jgi:hypothetical protein